MKKQGNIRYIRGLAFIALLFIIAASCSKSTDYGTTTPPGPTGGTTGPGTNQVFIQGMAFNPSVLTVTAGTTVTWVNKDAIAHTVTSSTNLFDSGSIGSNGSFTYTFATAGTFGYYCSIHPNMVASVKVN